jgi:hypothetical protein
MTHIAEAVLLTLVVIHAAIHVTPMMHHAHQRIHQLLGLKPGEKCDLRTAATLVAMMAATLCVACAPVVHYGLDLVAVVAA